MEQTNPIDGVKMVTHSQCRASNQSGNERRGRYEPFIPPMSQYKRTNWENPDPSKLITEDLPLVVLYLLAAQQVTTKPISQVAMISSIDPHEAMIKELEKAGRLDVIERRAERSLSSFDVRVRGLLTDDYFVVDLT